MKFLMYIFIVIFSFGAQAHNDQFLGTGIAHELTHVVLLFLSLIVAVAGVKYVKLKLRQHKTKAVK